MNIPTIEELDRIASRAAGREPGELLGFFPGYLTAIRDAVVAAYKPQLRPIAEMPEEVPEGFVRRFWRKSGETWYSIRTRLRKSTHYIDIALPEPTYPEDFEQAFAESGLDAKDKEAAFKLWKGGGVCDERRRIY